MMRIENFDPSYYRIGDYQLDWFKIVVWSFSVVAGIAFWTLVILALLG